MKRNIITIAVLLVAAAVAGLGVATVTVGKAAGSTQGAHRVYQQPQAWLDDASACYRAEREARGIPGDMDAYVAWWHAHEGTQVRADWSAAYAACQDAHLWRQGMWNWDSLVLVSGG
jgi:hypothetical protein